MENILMILAYILTGILLFVYAIQACQTVRAWLLRKSLGEVLLRFREHGNINFIVLGTLSLAGCLILAFLCYNNSISASNINTLGLFTTLLSYACFNFINALLYVEIRQEGIFTRRKLLRWDKIRHYEWQEKYDVTLDKEVGFYELKLIENDHSFKDETIKVRKSNSAALPDILKAKIVKNQ